MIGAPETRSGWTHHQDACINHAIREVQRLSGAESERQYFADYVHPPCPACGATQSCDHITWVSPAQFAEMLRD